MIGCLISLTNLVLARSDTSKQNSLSELHVKKQLRSLQQSEDLMYVM